MSPPILPIGTQVVTRADWRPPPSARRWRPARWLTRHHVHHDKGFAHTKRELFHKERPRRVKPLLYVYRVLLTRIHLMRTGRIESNQTRMDRMDRIGVTRRRCVLHSGRPRASPRHPPRPAVASPAPRRGHPLHPMHPSREVLAHPGTDPRMGPGGGPTFTPSR